LLADLPTVGDELALASWVADFKRVQSWRDYAIWHPGSGRLVARAEARWAYIDRVRGQPLRIAEEITTALAPLGYAMRVRVPRTVPPSDDPPHILQVTAREYEADSQQHINNCVYADWLGEALQQCLQAHVPQQKDATRPRYYAIEYLRVALPGDVLRIETQVVPWGRRGMGAAQTIVNNHTRAVHVRASSEHVHLRR